MLKSITKSQRHRLTNAVIFFVQNSLYCSKEKLYWLLYFLDTIYYRATGNCVTGLQYVVRKDGPRPKFNRMIYRALTCKDIVNRKFDGSCFTRRQLYWLHTLAFTYSADSVLKHYEDRHLPSAPWAALVTKGRLGAPIFYDLVLDTSAECTKERAELVSQEQKEARALFDD